MSSLPSSGARRSAPDSYWLNAFQIPALRALGFVILAIWVLVYDIFALRAFSFWSYFSFIAILAAYGLASWGILVYAWNRVRIFNLGALFLVMDLPFMLLAVDRTGANQSLLFF